MALYDGRNRAAPAHRNSFGKGKGQNYEEGAIEKKIKRRRESDDQKLGVGFAWAACSTAKSRLGGLQGWG